MENTLRKFTRLIAYILLVVAMVFISFQTLELIWETIRSFSARFSETGLQGLNYNPQYGKTVLVLFFNVLLALEILETIKVFGESHNVKVRIILLICLIAVSRKIFLMDMEKASAIDDFGTAALVITLSVSYYLVSRQISVEEEKIRKKPGDENNLV